MKKNLMNLRALKRPVALLVAAVFIQIIFGVIIMLPFSINRAITGEAPAAGNGSVYYYALCVQLVLAHITTILFAKKSLHMFKWNMILAPMGVSPSKAFVLILAAIAGIIGLDILSEILKLPNWLENDFSGINHNVLGFITLAVIAPIAEEIIFRGASQGWMHRCGMKPSWAIFFSALIFGLIHMNPVQIVVAGLMGIVLGILFWKTKSLVLPILLHIINNSISGCCSILCPEWSISDHCGGTLPALCVMAACLAVCVVVYWRFYKYGDAPQAVF